MLIFLLYLQISCFLCIHFKLKEENFINIQLQTCFITLNDAYISENFPLLIIINMHLSEHILRLSENLVESKQRKAKTELEVKINQGKATIIDYQIPRRYE